MSLLIVLTFCSLQTLNETIISVGGKKSYKNITMSFTHDTLFYKEGLDAEGRLWK